MAREGNGTLFTILAWRIPWTGRLHPWQTSVHGVAKSQTHQVTTTFTCVVQFSSVQFSPVTQVMSDSATPWTAAGQASLSITNSWSLLKLMSIKSVMPSNHLVLCHPLFLLLSTFPGIRIFSNESVLCIRWPKD